MRSLISFVLAILIPICIYGQEFLNNSSYIYAMGVGKTQQEADNEALIAFAKSIQTKINSVTRYSVSDDGENIVKNYSKDVQMEIAAIFEDTGIYADLNDGVYTVYRFLDKDKFIREHLAIYNAYMERVKEYLVSKDAHRINFLLGAYYLAYCGIDNVIMDVFNENNIGMKSYVIERAKQTYGQGYVLEFVKDKNNLVKVNAGLPLYGFQYKNCYQQWVEPSCFFESSNNLIVVSNIPQNKWFKCCSIDNGSNEIEVRTTYEVPMENNTVGIIDVPENWYFYKDNIKRF